MSDRERTDERDGLAALYVTSPWEPPRRDTLHHLIGMGESVRDVY